MSHTHTHTHTHTQSHSHTVTQSDYRQQTAAWAALTAPNVTGQNDTM